MPTFNEYFTNRLASSAVSTFLAEFVIPFQDIKPTTVMIASSNMNPIHIFVESFIFIPNIPQSLLRLFGYESHLFFSQHLFNIQEHDDLFIHFSHPNDEFTVCVKTVSGRR